MGEAFDLALDRLSLRHDHPAAEKVALVIFALVDAGETDPNKLAEEVVLQLKRNA